MKPRIYLSCLLILCLLGGSIGAAAPVYAAQECTKKDRSKIASFNHKANEYKQEYQKLKDDNGKVGTMGQALKYQRETAKIQSFFQSSEYNAMIPVYDRCQVMMPTL